MFFRRAYAISVGLGMKALGGGGVVFGCWGKGRLRFCRGGYWGGVAIRFCRLCGESRFSGVCAVVGFGGGALVVVWAYGGVGGGRPCFSGSFKRVSGGV